MSEQQSNKSAVKSETQKRATPPDTFEKHDDDSQSDKDTRQRTDSGRLAQRQKQWNERERSEDV